MENATKRDPYRSQLRRLALFGLLFIAFTAAGAWAVYDQFAGRSIAFDTRLLAPTTLAALTVLLALYFLADGLRLHYTLRALGHGVAPLAMTRLVFINLFFSNVTPLATGGGIAQVWVLRRHGVPIGRAIAATTLRTVLATAMIFVATPLYLLLGTSTNGHALLERIAPVLAVLVLLYVGFFAVALLRARWLMIPLSGALGALRRLELVGAHRHRRLQFALRREVLRFSRSFGEYLSGSPRFVALSMLFSLVFLISLFSVPALLIHALGHDIAYLTVMGMTLVTTFVMYFAPTPGAAGIAESVFGAFFADPLGPAHLVLVTLTWRFLTIHLGMLAGLALLACELGAGARSRA